MPGRGSVTCLYHRSLDLRFSLLQTTLVHVIPDVVHPPHSWSSFCPLPSSSSTSPCFPSSVLGMCPCLGYLVFQSDISPPNSPNVVALPPSPSPFLPLSLPRALLPSLLPSLTPSFPLSLPPSFPPSLLPSLTPSLSPSLTPSLSPSLPLSLPLSLPQFGLHFISLCPLSPPTWKHCKSLMHPLRSCLHTAMFLPTPELDGGHSWM